MAFSPVNIYSKINQTMSFLLSKLEALQVYKQQFQYIIAGVQIANFAINSDVMRTTSANTTHNWRESIASLQSCSLSITGIREDSDGAKLIFNQATNSLPIGIKISDATFNLDGQFFITNLNYGQNNNQLQSYDVTLISTGQVIINNVP